MGKLKCWCQFNTQNQKFWIKKVQFLNPYSALKCDIQNHYFLNLISKKFAIILAYTKMTFKQLTQWFPTSGARMWEISRVSQIIISLRFKLRFLWNALIRVLKTCKGYRCFVLFFVLKLANHNLPIIIIFSSFSGSFCSAVVNFINIIHAHFS